MTHLLCSIISILCLLSPAIALGFGSVPSFRHYSSANGLPSNCIRDILQDSCGFVWFATDGGLARFDGKEFRVFKPSALSDSIHIDNYVSSLAQSGNYIWLATDDGLMRYDRRTEQLDKPQLTYPAGKSTPHINGTSRRLAVDPDGNIWACMSSRGVFRIEPSLAVTHYDLPGTTNYVGTVFVDRRGEIWATGSYTSNGLFRLDKQNGRFERIDIIVNDSPVMTHSMAMAEDDSNRLWIGLWTEGLVCLDPFTGNARIIHADNPEKLFHIHSITTGADGSLLIGTDNGLSVYNPADGSFTLYAHDELRQGSMSGQFVYPIMRDIEGGLWIGTFYAGVNYLAPDIKHFESSRHSRFVNSVSGNIISSFCEDAQGNIYIGSEDGGLCRYDTSTGIYTHIPLGGGNNTDNVHSLCLDGDDLWIGTYSNGIKIYDTRRQRITRDYSHTKTTGGEVITNSYAVARDRQGNIWAATMNSILRYDRANDTFIEMRNTGALTADIKQDAAGNLWFSTQGQGLFRYKPHTGEWDNYRWTRAKGSLIHNHVSCIDFDNRGNLWVATGNGVARYRPETDDFEEIDLGANDKMIFFIKSSGNDLWIGTGHGLIRYRRDEQPTTFTEVDGLANNQFSLNSVFTTSAGMIYVGTIDGFTCFDPARIGSNTTVPELRFTGLDIGGHHVMPGDDRLPCSLNCLERLELDPDAHVFSISFAALSYANPDNNCYMYRLEGFDKEWMTADNTNKATYTNLPPGDYTFRVKASNNDKVWNEAGISLPIHIAPHWYSSWPMKGAYIIIACCIIFLIAYIIMKRNDRLHHEELERVKSAKEREVYEAKLNFFTTIAHEIRTPVSLIIGPLESIMKSESKFTPEQNDDFDIIHRNTRRLLFLVNQLLDFKKVESLAMDAKFIAHDIPALVESVAERFSPSLSHRGMTLKVGLPAEHFKADVDAEALTKLVSNLLNNARKFTKSLVTVTCENHPDVGTFTITVTDDGIGISENDLRRIFKPFVQIESSERQEGGTGLGLSIVKRVVKAHSGSIDVKSQPGLGSSFIVTLPLHQATAINSDELIAEEPSVDLLATSGQEADVRNCMPDHPVMLITDDNNDLVRFLSNYFRSTFTVITAASADEAIGRLENETVDLIVSDWMMPGMSGIDFCRHVRNNRATSHIPFLLLTAKTDENSKIEGMNCGADAYVEKPFSIDYLSARISNLLEMRRLLKQKFSSAPLEPIETLAVNPVDSQFLSQLTSLIEENFSNTDLSVDFLAQRLCISRSSLYSKIRTLADSTPNELIQLTRLKRAAQLLTENRYRINEICYMVGFNSPSYFSKCFQRQFGMKPGEFKG